MLMRHHHAQPAGMLGMPQAQCRSVDLHRPLVGPVLARDNTGKRRFARTIGYEKPQSLTGMQRQVDYAQGADAAIMLNEDHCMKQRHPSLRQLLKGGVIRRLLYTGGVWL